MAGGNNLFGGSNMTVLLQNERLPCSSEVFDSLWVHTSDPPSFQGSKSVVDFENGGRGSGNSNRVVTDRPFLQGLVEKEEQNGGDDDLYDACFHHQGGNKKRRLTSEQVQFLERNFELENKLEPERKVQLAKELGLQPRQVAIWFQNRRARFKTKQLEKEYGTLKASYDKLKGDCDNLLQQNDKLKEEVNSLKNKLIPRDKEKGNSSSDNKPSSPPDAAVNSSPHNKNKNKEDPIMMVDLVSNAASSCENNNKVPPPIMVTLTCKQEDANSSKSDVLDDSDSPHRISDSSQAFEPDHSDFSQDEEDNLSENLLTLPCLPKVEASCYHHEPPLPPENNACGFGFPVEDQAFCFWPY